MGEPAEIHTATSTQKGCSSIIRARYGNVYVRSTLRRWGRQVQG